MFQKFLIRVSDFIVLPCSLRYQILSFNICNRKFRVEVWKRDFIEYIFDKSNGYLRFRHSYHTIFETRPSGEKESDSKRCDFTKGYFLPHLKVDMGIQIKNERHSLNNKSGNWKIIVPQENVCFVQSLRKIFQTVWIVAHLIQLQLSRRWLTE